MSTRKAIRYSVVITLDFRGVSFLHWGRYELIITHFLSRFAGLENKATNLKDLSIVIKIIVLVSLHTFFVCV